MPDPGRRDTWRRGWCAQRELNPHVGLMKKPASDPVSCARPSVGAVMMPESERRVVWTDVALAVPEGIRTRGVATSVGRSFAGAVSRPTDGKVEASDAFPIELSGPVRRIPTNRPKRAALDMDYLRPALAFISIRAERRQIVSIGVVEHELHDDPAGRIPPDHGASPPNLQEELVGFVHHPSALPPAAQAHPWSFLHCLVALIQASPQAWPFRHTRQHVGASVVESGLVMAGAWSARASRWGTVTSSRATVIACTTRRPTRFGGTKSTTVAGPTIA